jgi:outer membrane biosynthesis protein TonB
VGNVPMLSGAGAAQGGAAAARTASAKAQPAADLFGNLDAAGGEHDDSEVATSARSVPVLPGSSSYDDKPTGARNENSVLFSLDALKAGFSGGPAPAAPSKPKASRPEPARAKQPSNPDDPFGMGSNAGIAGLGTGNSPLFSLSANQALISAPPPPEPKPITAPAVSLPGGSIPAGMDEKTKKLVLFGGVGAGAVILLLLGLLVFGGKKDKEQASADTAASAASAEGAGDKKSEPAAKAEEPKTETHEEKKEEPAPSAAAPSASAEKKEEAKPEASKTDAKPSSDSKAGTSHASTTSTKKDEPEPAGPSNAPPFSKASAISVLGAAASSAAACKKAGGPTGVGKVQVTFAPSGRVTSATVMGPPFAGTAVGGCAANAFKRA